MRGRSSFRPRMQPGTSQRDTSPLWTHISATLAHASAAKNPKLLGGPFVDLDGKRFEEVRALRDRIKRDRSLLIKLSAALKALDELVRGSARGWAAHPLYPQVPEILRGYVELVYDLNNQPSFRLFESLSVSQ